MKLEITLSATEQANIRAWQSYLASHPEYIGKTTGDWIPGAPTYQTKIILEEQTRERYEEIAAQVAGHTGIPVDVAEVELTPGAPPNDFTFKSGRARAYRNAGTVAGNASASVAEGGAGLYGVVLDSAPASVTVPEFTAWGPKAINGLAIKPGQWFVIYSESPTALGGRADIRSA